MTAYASAARIEGLFDQARQLAPVGELVEREGLKLVRAGQEQRSACPMCGAGSKSLSAFAIKGPKWRCYGACDTHGDVVDLEQALRGGTAVEAARRLVGREVPTGPARTRSAAPPAPAGPSSADRLAVELWRDSQPFANTLGERYLRKRGIAAEVVALAAPQLRYHPNAKHSWDPARGSWICAPAMIVRVVTASGPTGGVHVTYLDKATAAKVAWKAAKRMWGPQLDAEGRSGGAWLIGPAGEGALVVAEGIETGLSVATLSLRAGLAVRVCAALSLNRLQGGVLKDADGCIDPFKPQPDPKRPPFTWPTPDAGGWPEVLVAVDRDGKPVKLSAKTGRGRICGFTLDSEARAKLCGRLAVKAWLAAGAPKARAIAPSAGSDFNDDLRRLLARESAA